VKIEKKEIKAKPDYPCIEGVRIKRGKPVVFSYLKGEKLKKFLKLTKLSV
jgi:hypothetical protein